VVEGFASYREAARVAIIGAGGKPVLVNEELMASDTSSRNACLDAVESCDIFLLLIGQRGGWHAPSGKLVVEEELERAQLRHLRCLIFIQIGIEQDGDASTLSRHVSDYVNGYFRSTFHNEAELKISIREALKIPLTLAKVPIMDTAALQKSLTIAKSLIQNQASIRFVLAPQRTEEVFSPMMIASEDFGERVLQIGHATEFKLFSYYFAKSKPTIENSRFVLTQDGGSNWQSGQQEIRVEIGENGTVMLDLNVTPRCERRDDYGVGGILQDDLSWILSRCFSFVLQLYTTFDPHRRQEAFVWGTALAGSGHRRILKHDSDSASCYPNMSGTEGAVVAFPDLRPITRVGLSQHGEEIERATLAWQNKLNESLR
jgi:hypothetical protein